MQYNQYKDDLNNYPGTLWSPLTATSNSCRHCTLAYSQHGAAEITAIAMNVPVDQRRLICRVRIVQDVHEIAQAQTANDLLRIAHGQGPSLLEQVDALYMALQKHHPFSDADVALSLALLKYLYDTTGKFALPEKAGA